MIEKEVAQNRTVGMLLEIADRSISLSQKHCKKTWCVIPRSERRLLADHRGTTLVIGHELIDCSLGQVPSEQEKLPLLRRIDLFSFRCGAEFGQGTEFQLADSLLGDP
jgi:hypothetical protein